MKKILKITLLSTLICLTLTACGITEENPKKTVVATTFAAYDWAKNITQGSENIEVKYLIDNKIDLHSYQPSASDIVAYKNADLLIYIGGESDEWVNDLDIDYTKRLPLIDCVEKKEEEVKEGMQSNEEGEESEVEYDEHIWLSLRNAGRCVEAIKTAITEIDSTNKPLYENNAENYIKVLNDLDSIYKATVDSFPNKTLIFADRFPFRYMVEDYGLNYYAAFTGCSAETEASFDTIVFLAQKLNELNLKNICVIGSNTEIARAVRENALHKDVGIVTFDSMQSISNKMADNTSYIDIMGNNVSVLQEALKTRS